VKRALAAVVLLPFVAACSSGSSASPNAPTSSAPPSSAGSSATIVTLNAPASVRCGAASSTIVAVTYAVAGSVRRELDVDGLAGPELAQPQGVVRAPVHCDDLEHTAVLVAVDAHGARTTRTKTFATVAGAR
jgi:hypothetical protein